MITLKKLIFLLLLLSAGLAAQVTYSVIIPATPPGGIGAACNSASIGYLAPLGGGNAQIVTCENNVWSATGGGGGTNPPACVAGTGGAVCYGEGTAPSVGPASGVDVIYADSTQHNFLSSLNNGSYFPLVQSIGQGTIALATGSISSAACTSAQTAAATGVLTTDIVLASFNGDPTAVTGFVPLTTGMLTIIGYPTANTVNFKVCNNTSGPITPGAITLNWKVTR